MFSGSCNAASLRWSRNETMSQAMSFSHRWKSVEARLMLNVRKIPFVDSVEYFGIIFDKRITWRLYTETVATKAFRTFLGSYPFFKSSRLSTTIKWTHHTAPVRSVMTYAHPSRIPRQTPTSKTTATAKQGFQQHW